jgi:hypothetical protein
MMKEFPMKLLSLAVLLATLVSAPNAFACAAFNASQRRDSTVGNLTPQNVAQVTQSQAAKSKR